MTQDEKVKALLKAVDVYTDQQHTDRIGNVSAWETLKAARAAFEPEPELEYGPMPEYENLAVSFGPGAFVTVKGAHDALHHHDFKTYYNQLRELTRVPKKPKGREFWLDTSKWRAYGTAFDGGPDCIRVQEVIGDTP